MREEQFERTMDAWAERETASAPAMRPTAEMYRMVQARVKPGFLSLLLARRAVLTTAAVSLALLAVLYVWVYDPFTLFRPPHQEVTAVAMRAGFPSQKGLVVRPTMAPARRGSEEPGIFFEQLWFQFQQPDSRFVVAMDVRGPQEESIVLTSADNYRLVLEPATDGYAYVFQLTSAGGLVQLLPNGGDQLTHDPLRRGQAYYLPAEPQWFYLGEGKGEESLYIIASLESLPELDSLYASYKQATSAREKQELLSSLLEALHAIEQIGHGETAAWLFEFRHR